MYRLPQPIIVWLFLLMFSSILAQSPHGNNLKIDCAQCHNSEGWKMNYETLRFNHTSTGFELEGAHKTIDCKDCHKTLVFENTPNECASCHKDIHNNSVGNDCKRCHSSNDWLVPNITNVHEENGFPLVGSHANLSCVECHTSDNNLTFTRIGNDCISCHLKDYNATSSPNHISAGFSTNCTDCHSPLSTDGWTSSIATNHSFFPLELGHSNLNCTQCHKSGGFEDLSPQCVSCHQQDYNGTANPNHLSSGYSTNCNECHSLNPGWRPAAANHDFFPLTLGHSNLNCTDCHLTSNYSDTSPDCFSCHQTDYNQATNPNHASSGFPTSCVDCHTTNPDWKPATFNHNFPIYNGNHARGSAWNQCNECHPTAGDFTVFSCFGCHGQNNMDNEHRGINGYAYSNPLCLQCHPTGED